MTMFVIAYLAYFDSQLTTRVVLRSCPLSGSTLEVCLLCNWHRSSRN